MFLNILRYVRFPNVFWVSGRTHDRPTM